MKNGRSLLSLVLNGPRSRARFESLQGGYQSYIEEQLGQVEWRPLPAANEKQAGITRMGMVDVPATWPETFDWLAGSLTRWREALKPIVKQLDGSPFDPAQGEEQDDDAAPAQAVSQH